MLSNAAEPTEVYRQNHPFDLALWVATIMLGSSAVREPAIFFQPASSPAFTLLWLGLYALAVLSLFSRRGVGWVLWLLRFRLLLLLALSGAIASALWAVDPNLSLQRSVHLFGCGVLAIHAGFFLSPKTLLDGLLWTSGFLLLLSIAAVLGLPELGVHAYEGDLVWRGTFANKNALGFWSAMTALLAFCCIQGALTWTVRTAIALIALMALICLIESKSATSLLALVVGLGVAAIIAICRRMGLGLAQQVLLSLLACACAVALFQAIDTHWINALLGRSSTLTGRGDVWAQTWALVLERPLGGYGYGNLWNPTDQSVWIQERYTNFSWIVYHAHNGLLQIASELGLIIAGLITIFVLQQLLESLHCHNQLHTEHSLFIVLFSVALLLSNYAEARLLIDRDGFWIIYLALPIGLLQSHGQPDGCHAPSAPN